MTSSGKQKQNDKSGAVAKLKASPGEVRKLADRILPGWMTDAKSRKFQKWALIVVTSFLAAFIMAPKHFRIPDITVGEPARSTIISPITFRVVDQEATNKNRDEVLKSILPVYDFDDAMAADVQLRINEAFAFMREYLEQEAKHNALVVNRAPDAAGKPKELQKTSFKKLDTKTLRTRFQNKLGARVSPSAFAMLKTDGFTSMVQAKLRSLVEHVLKKGVIASREDALTEGKNGILLWSRSKSKLVPLKDLSSVFDLKEAYNYINFGQDPEHDNGLSRSIRQIALDLINLNITYDRERSAKLKREALANVKPVYFQVVKGEPIIRAGDPVNEGHVKRLLALKKANPLYSRYMILFGFALTLIIVLRLTFYFSERYLDRSKPAIQDLLLTCLLVLFTILLARFTATLSPLIVSAGDKIDTRSLFYAAPIATGAMLMGLMVNGWMAFIFATLGALTAALAVEGDVYLFCFYFISGVVGLHGMTRITDRTSILRAGLVVGLVNMLTIVAIKMALGELTRFEQFYLVGFGFIGGLLSGLLVSGMAPLLEPLGYITNVKLLEIANLNHPLLKELAMRAPGTYHHSIIVGNMAEAAAEEIGADPLLTRVGALYHDIGKVGKKAKPGYFIENQQRGFNPHDKLEPSMSALILVSHVKYGVEKAKEHRLGAPIIDIIREHHGTNLIKFFYSKAVTKAAKNGKTVREDAYRYHGPSPQTKEAALVMLADVVEAASRTLADPTPARIQKHVQSLIMGLFSEGQLDQSTLTLKDLHRITKSYVRSLQGILHHRIDYPRAAAPQEKANGDSSKQQAENNKNRQGGSEEESPAAIRRLGL